MSSVADSLAKKTARPAAAKRVPLKLVHIDFWSAVKLSFLVSLALGIILVVSSLLIWLVLNQTGIFTNLSELFGSILSSSSSDFDITDVVGLPQVLGFTLVVALLNVVTGTALGAIAAALYNLSVRVTGGLLVGFASQ